MLTDFSTNQDTRRPFAEPTINAMKPSFTHLLWGSFLSILFLSCVPKQVDELPVLLEIVDDNYRISENGLKRFCVSLDIDPCNIRQWENHYLIQLPGKEALSSIDSFRQLFPELRFRVFEQPIYVFDRQQHCGEAPVEEWDQVVWSTSLVADTVMQEEYMQYHRTQFEEWPEVAEGFCRAQFQRLLLYRSGRQLMILISYPKGEDYDALNRLTTLDNPRVDEWNELMSRYQVPLDQASEDEVWIQFTQIP